MKKWTGMLFSISEIFNNPYETGITQTHFRFPIEIYIEDAEANEELEEIEAKDEPATWWWNNQKKGQNFYLKNRLSLNTILFQTHQFYRF